MDLLSFPGSSAGKESACNAGDPGLIPGSGTSLGEGIGYPLQYSWASRVAQLVKKCLQCGRSGFNSQVGNIPWRRERLPTPVFWPGEFQGLYGPCCHKELDTTEWLSPHFTWWNHLKTFFSITPDIKTPQIKCIIGLAKAIFIEELRLSLNTVI